MHVRKISESNSSALCQQWVQRDLDQVLSSFDLQSFHYMNDVFLFAGQEPWSQYPCLKSVITCLPERIADDTGKNLVICSEVDGPRVCHTE